ncbi:Prokaryotic metallothionein [Haloechinothrix sp. LS1_15]|uniref:Prokaryotic metallothionein n=1 Tax=Haloechinothrix sp. LS1_15 TaxID=2652248 RepID=UPI0029473EA1|nr:Prokaryotic metallothionein [Haloechinothrix sp. LS1_15]MDV6013019.1 Prokaryotic metallothionein [Haloechinothrix sp. LS1_15]
MATCDVCGNDYWMAFEVHTASGHRHTFDSIECAAQRIAPECEHCRCRILGHGVEIDGRFFCCAHCARTADSTKGMDIRDTVGVHPG